MRSHWSLALIPLVPVVGLLAACNEPAYRVSHDGAAPPMAATTAPPAAAVIIPPAAAVATPPATVVTTTTVAAPPPTVITTAPPPVVHAAPTVRTETITLCTNGTVFSPRLGYCVAP